MYEKIKDKETIEKIIHELIDHHGFKARELCIATTSAMILNNMEVEADDLDIHVTKEYFDGLWEADSIGHGLAFSKDTKPSIVPGQGDVKSINIVLGIEGRLYKVEMVRSWLDAEKERCSIAPFPVFFHTLQTVVYHKSQLMRPKDIKDISQIGQFVVKRDPKKIPGTIPTNLKSVLEKLPSLDMTPRASPMLESISAMGTGPFVRHMRMMETIRQLQKSGKRIVISLEGEPERAIGAVKKLYETDKGFEAAIEFDRAWDKEIDMYLQLESSKSAKDVSPEFSIRTDKKRPPAKDLPVVTFTKLPFTEPTKD